MSLKCFTLHSGYCRDLFTATTKAVVQFLCGVSFGNFAHFDLSLLHNPLLHQPASMGSMDEMVESHPTASVLCYFQHKHFQTKGQCRGEMKKNIVSKNTSQLGMLFLKSHLV